MVTTVTNNSVQQINTSLFALDAEIQKVNEEISNTSSDLATSRQVLTIMDENNPDNFPSDGMRVYRVKNYNIGWVSNDGFIINIPWSDAFAFQIAMDNQSNWMAVRSKANGTWSAWQRVSLEPLSS